MSQTPRFVPGTSAGAPAASGSGGALSSAALLATPVLATNATSTRPLSHAQSSTALLFGPTIPSALPSSSAELLAAPVPPLSLNTGAVSRGGVGTPAGGVSSRDLLSAPVVPTKVSSPLHAPPHAPSHTPAHPSSHVPSHTHAQPTLPGPVFKMTHEEPEVSTTLQSAASSSGPGTGSGTAASGSGPNAHTAPPPPTTASSAAAGSSARAVAEQTLVRRRVLAVAAQERAHSSALNVHEDAVELIALAAETRLRQLVASLAATARARALFHASKPREGLWELSSSPLKFLREQEEALRLERDPHAAESATRAEDATAGARKRKRDNEEEEGGRHDAKRARHEEEKEKEKEKEKEDELTPNELTRLRVLRQRVKEHGQKSLNPLELAELRSLVARYTKTTARASTTTAAASDEPSAPTLKYHIAGSDVAYFLRHERSLRAGLLDTRLVLGLPTASAAISTRQQQHAD